MEPVIDTSTAPNAPAAVPPAKSSAATLSQSTPGIPLRSWFAHEGKYGDSNTPRFRAVIERSPLSGIPPRGEHAHRTGASAAAHPDGLLAAPRPSPVRLAKPCSRGSMRSIAVQQRRAMLKSAVATHPRPRPSRSCPSSAHTRSIWTRVSPRASRLPSRSTRERAVRYPETTRRHKQAPAQPATKKHPTSQPSVFLYLSRLRRVWVPTGRPTTSRTVAAIAPTVTL
jgi:hypothetical protein